MSDDELIERMAEAIRDCRKSEIETFGQFDRRRARAALAVARPAIHNEAADAISVAMNADLEKHDARGVGGVWLATRAGGWLNAWEAVRSLRLDSKEGE